MSYLFSHEERMNELANEILDLKEEKEALEKALCKAEDEYDNLVRRLKEFVKEVEK